MKTNTRVRRNSGSKPVPSQVPNKPDTSPGNNLQSGPRYEGIVQGLDDKTSLGIIEVTPEVAAELKLSDARQLIFLKYELPQGRELDLRVGARVTFCIDAARGSRIATGLNAITLAADLPADGWQPITIEFIKSMIELYEVKGASLNRDQFGRLFVSRKPTDGRGRGTEVREVSFVQACDWLVNQGHEMIPEGFLRRHGILEQAETTAIVKEMRNLDLDDAADSAFTLIELMEQPFHNAEEFEMSKERQDAFTNGLINLTSRVQKDLLALKASYRAALKGGAV